MRVMINDFLKSVANDIKKTNKDLSADDFYYILKYLGVKKNVSLVQDIEKFYEDFLENLNNSLVRFENKSVKSGENATHYLAFYVDKKADYREAVKVYFAVKYEYMISALKTIFLYLVRNNVKSQVKFHVKETNEGIVIRFYDKKDVMPFINYCNNNFILSDLLHKVNPFIPTIYGIGLVEDDNTINTYNGTLSELLCEYFSLLKINDNILQASDLDFLDYVLRREKMEDQKQIKFNISSIRKNIEIILNHANPIDEKDLI